MAGYARHGLQKSNWMLALIVAATGIYSRHLVPRGADRTHEIGVRLALGARRTDVATLILRSSVGMTAVGALLGCMGALWASPLMETLLFNESPRDPLIYAGAALSSILVVAVCAGILPSVRANRISPLSALRVD